MTITSEISYINIFSCSASMGSIGNGSQGGSKDLLSFHNDTSFFFFFSCSSHKHCALCSAPHLFSGWGAWNIRSLSCFLKCQNLSFQTVHQNPKRKWNLWTSVSAYFRRREKFIGISVDLSCSNYDSEIKWN